MGSWLKSMTVFNRRISDFRIDRSCALGIRGSPPPGRVGGYRPGAVGREGQLCVPTAPLLGGAIAAVESGKVHPEDVVPVIWSLEMYKDPGNARELRLGAACRPIDTSEFGIRLQVIHHF